MGVKEKDLQTIEQLSEGDKLRVVTSEGNSRNIDAEAIGNGGSVVLPILGENGEHLTKTYSEIYALFMSGTPIIIAEDNTGSYIYEQIHQISVYSYNPITYQIGGLNITGYFLSGEENDYPELVID